MSPSLSAPATTSIPAGTFPAPKPPAIAADSKARAGTVDGRPRLQAPTDRRLDERAASSPTRRAADAAHQDRKQTPSAAGSAPAVLDGWYGPVRQGWLETAKPWAKGMLVFAAAYGAYHKAMGSELDKNDVLGRAIHLGVSLLAAGAGAILAIPSEAPFRAAQMTAAQALDAMVAFANRQALTSLELARAVDKVRQAGQANPGLSGRQLAEAMVSLGLSGIPWQHAGKFTPPRPGGPAAEGVAALQAVFGGLERLAVSGRCTWQEYTDAVSTLMREFGPRDPRAPGRAEAVAALKRAAGKCPPPALNALLACIPQELEFPGMETHRPRERAQAFIWLPDDDLAGQAASLRDELQSVQDPVQRARAWVAVAGALGRRTPTPPSSAVLGDGLLSPQAIAELIDAVVAAPPPARGPDRRAALVAGLMPLAQAKATPQLLRSAWAALARLPGLRPLAGESQDEREDRRHRLTQARIEARDHMIRRLVPLQGRQQRPLQLPWLARVDLPQPD